MFHFRASSQSIFICFACRALDDLQCVCTGTHRGEHCQNKKGDEIICFKLI